MQVSKLSTPSAQDLLHFGEPFAPFSEFPVQAIHNDPSWFEAKLREGKPFVIRGLNRTAQWDELILSNECLTTSSPGVLPVRNCQTGRDVKMRLHDLLSPTDARVGHVRDFLYAKDLHCPTEWIEALQAVLPSCLMQLGSFDLFRVLPKDIMPEVLMAYVGTRMSFSGFHRCFSGTVALNLMVESEGNKHGSICFGTDKNSQAKYDAFMERLGNSAHTDWANLSLTQLESADFPIYVTHQEPGDLVIFPSATAHQIWNVSPMVTKVVWNIMHTSSLVSFFNYVQPAYQSQCHTDTGRVPLIPMHAIESGCQNAEQMKLLVDIFQKLVDDEDTGSDSMIRIKLVDTQGAVVECNFCGLTIWNRHLHCEQCGDFDLCLTCYISGRSCKHVLDFTWAELFPKKFHQTLLQAAREELGGYSSPQRERSRQKTLGSLAVIAANSRRQSVERLCHLCRDNHPIWKGVQCPQCSAFFCLRGLYRHFDIDLLGFLRNMDSWACPKCSQICNCRCCHFPHPYQSKAKPVRARIKAVDSRGRISGFVDNVFDQRRGKRAITSTQSMLLHPAEEAHGPKRPRMQSDDKSSVPHGLVNPSLESLANSRNGSSVGSLGSKGQLRISDLVEDRAYPDPSFSRSHRVQTHVLSHSTPEDPSYQRPRELSSYNASTFPASNEEENIPSLEKKLAALRKYADDLLELSLVESHAKVEEKISELETQIERRKRQKAETLFNSLNRDFPDLATIAMEEARRRGI
ncbi:hypothetical protein BDV25DRAFT_162242 [Aspergillus avenaceus]|uniref:JmjC domain-containing protein n=1 Tax=Aspergillus avenaceus TaxID=36643 RepID=A0A5N6TKD6_ASPAV|nr:hypothetical protein BDV25DRAFT_162242 [Aspergillus avenaceus]